MSASDESNKEQHLHQYSRMFRNMTPLEVLESVAFNFRSDLTTIKGFTKLSLQNKDNQEYVECINEAVEHIVDYLQIVTEFIDDYKANFDSE